MGQRLIKSVQRSHVDSIEDGSEELELNSYNWFFGKISKDSAHNLLRRYGCDGTFLVRNSETNTSEFTISLRQDNVIKHFRLTCDCEQFYYFQNSLNNKKFVSIPVLVNHFMKKENKKQLDLVQACVPDEVTDSYEILPWRVSVGLPIGEGETSTVMKGRWNGSVVALKKFKETKVLMAHSEINILKELNHPKIVYFNGTCLKDTKLYVVLELMTSSLATHLKKMSCVPSLALQLKYGKAIVEGMKYLESKRIIHRDLAARNVLIKKCNKEVIVKISDFGLSVCIKKGEKEYIETSSIKFPMKWLAPEVFHNNSFSFKSDVWSFGVTLYEICSKGCEPFPKLTGEEAVTKVSNDVMYRLPLPIGCEERMYIIMNDCWKNDRDERTTFDGLLADFEDYYQNYCV